MTPTNREAPTRSESMEPKLKRQKTDLEKGRFVKIDVTEMLGVGFESVLDLNSNSPVSGSTFLTLMERHLAKEIPFVIVIPTDRDSSYRHMHPIPATEFFSWSKLKVQINPCTGKNINDLFFFTISHYTKTGKDQFKYLGHLNEGSDKKQFLLNYVNATDLSYLNDIRDTILDHIQDYYIQDDLPQAPDLVEESDSDEITPDPTSDFIFQEKFDAERLKNKVMEAQYSLGYTYENGFAVTQNLNEAFIWHLKAAAHGCFLSQQRIITMYSEGIGTSKNLDAANKWALIALDHKERDRLIEQVYLNLIHVLNHTCVSWNTSIDFLHSIPILSHPKFNRNEIVEFQRFFKERLQEQNIVLNDTPEEFKNLVILKNLNS